MGNSENEVFEKVKKVLVRELNAKEEDIERDTYIQDDLGADSLDMVEVVMALEEEFDLEIPDEDAEKIVTVGQVVEYIVEKTEKG